MNVMKQCTSFTNLTVRYVKLIMEPLFIWLDWRVPSFTPDNTCLLSKSSACQKMMVTLVFVGIINVTANNMK